MTLSSKMAGSDTTWIRAQIEVPGHHERRIGLEKTAVKTHLIHLYLDSIRVALNSHTYHILMEKLVRKTYTSSVTANFLLKLLLSYDGHST